MSQATPVGSRVTIAGVESPHTLQNKVTVKVYIYSALPMLLPSTTCIYIHMHMCVVQTMYNTVDVCLIAVWMPMKEQNTNLAAPCTGYLPLLLWEVPCSASHKHPTDGEIEH